MVICVERGADDLHVVQMMPLPPVISCFIELQIGLTFLVLAYPVLLEKESVERVSGVGFW